MKLNYFDPVLSAKSGTTKLVKYDNVVYDHEWADLSDCDVTTLLAGNHEFPFDVVIPGSVEESVEGLEGAQVIYKLIARIERGRFASDVVVKKHIRVVRTLTPDALELTQTMCVDQTWPKKVEYSISIPAKAIAIGSYTHLYFKFVPLLKGLSISRVKVGLLEFKHLTNGAGSNLNSEKLIHEETIKVPVDLSEDIWTFDDSFQIPSSLAKLTQDCQIGDHIQVTHKLRFSVILKNPDGHQSELRASLPISLFISPHVTISSLHHPSSDTIPHQSMSSNEDLIFTTARQQNNSLTEIVNAPPSYNAHIFDQLYGSLPTPHLDTPLASGQTTPQVQDTFISHSPHTISGPAFEIDRTRLIRNLYALQETQSNSTAEEASSSHTSPISTPSPSSPDLLELCKVPSYHTAVTCNDPIPVDCTPIYKSSTTDSPASPPASTPPSVGVTLNEDYFSSSSRNSSFTSFRTRSKVFLNGSTGAFTHSHTNSSAFHRTSSSRSLLDEAGKLLHIHK